MSASTAEILLAKRTLRWSAPTEFNDPFDVPRELALNLQPSDIMKSIRGRYLKLIENPPDDLSRLKPELQLLITTIKKYNSSELNKELIADLQKETAPELLSSYPLDAFREHWRKLVCDMRILCLCESPNKTSMWYHYADKYKGAVLEFLCNDDSGDSPWRIAKPIKYIDDEPLVSTTDGWARLLMMPQDDALSTLFDICMYTKSKDWEYEKEWRVVSFKRAEDSGVYTDYKFGEREIGNLYLGPLIDPKVKERLISASIMYSNMQVFEANIGASRQITFNKING